MMKPLVLAGLLAFAATAFAATPPFKGDNCAFEAPPPEAGDDLDHGAVLKVHPRAKDIGASYTGCQFAWAESRGHWPVVGVAYFERGQVAGFWSPPPGETTCRYRRGRPVDDKRGECPPVDRLKLKAMPAGCGRRILLKVGDTKDCKPE